MTFAFDIDGTLLQHPKAPDYLSPASLRLASPILAACARVRDLIQSGKAVHFITARSHEVRAVTLEQLQQHIHEGITAQMLTTQAEFQGYDKMAAYKAAALLECGAVGYVGDHAADRQAANLAKVPFLFAHEYGAGEAWS